MAKPKKLPSGNWRIQVGYTDETGKYCRESITAETKKEAQFLADEFLLDMAHKKKPENKSLRQIATEYVDSIENVRSPSTIAGYRKIINKSLSEEILEARIGFITKEMYQKAINDYSKNHKPQTVINVHNIFSNALKWKGINLLDNISLPQKDKTEIKIPSDEEIKQLLNYCNGTRIDLLIKFAIYLGMRKSEIMALTWKDVDFENKKLTVNKALVFNEYKEAVIKQPKTKSGYRTLTIPDILLNDLRSPGEQDERIINDSPKALESMYKRIMKKLGLNYSFHALRHYNASIMLKENIPNRYAKERMGHSTEDMLRKVYQHTFPEKHQEYDDKINNFFNTFDNTSSKNE